MACGVRGDIFQPVIIRQSPIHGLGCFAPVSLHPKATIIEYVGEYITLVEAVLRNNPSSYAFSPYILKLRENRFIDGRYLGNESRFINHCCDSNCTVQRSGKRAFIVASRSIICDEELTIDYCYDEDQHEPCSCGTRYCRGFI